MGGGHPGAAGHRDGSARAVSTDTLSRRFVAQIAQALSDDALHAAMQAHAMAASKAAHEANERQRWAAAMSREIKRRKKEKAA